MRPSGPAPKGSWQGTDSGGGLVGGSVQSLCQGAGSSVPLLLYQSTNRLRQRRGRAGTPHLLRSFPKGLVSTTGAFWGWSRSAEPRKWDQRLCERSRTEKTRLLRPRARTRAEPAPHLPGPGLGLPCLQHPGKSTLRVQQLPGQWCLGQRPP